LVSSISVVVTCIRYGIIGLSTERFKTISQSNKNFGYHGLMLEAVTSHRKYDQMLFFCLFEAISFHICLYVSVI